MSTISKYAFIPTAVDHSHGPGHLLDMNASARSLQTLRDNSDVSTVQPLSPLSASLVMTPIEPEMVTPQSNYPIGLWHLLKRWLHPVEHDLERQPLLPEQTLLPEQPRVEYSWSEWCAQRKYAVLVSVVVCGLVVLTLFTGDGTLLVVLLKGVLCYFLGRDLSSALFGRGFCPAIKLCDPCLNSL